MVIANLIGVFVFLFFVWKRLKEDYHFEKNFSLATYTLVGVLVSFFVAKYFFPYFWFWIEVAGIMFGFGVGILRQKMRGYESFEAILVGLLIWLSLIFVSDSVINLSLTSFLAFWVSLSCVFLFFFLDAHYRRFSWYKSGRVGFSGLATVGTFFLIRSIVAPFHIPVISLVGSWEGIMSGMVAFVSFLLLFNLSRAK